jgi:hypothetical protein
MRYVKALLAFLTTAIAVFASAAVTRADPALGESSGLVLIAIFAWWAPAIVYVVGSPVRWVEGLLRAEGATVASIAKDREYSTVERTTIAVGIAVSVAAGAALISTTTSSGSTGRIVISWISSATAAASLGGAIRRSIAVGPIRRT